MGEGGGDKSVNNNNSKVYHVNIGAWCILPVFTPVVKSDGVLRGDILLTVPQYILTI